MASAYYRREFLNSDEGIALLEASVDNDPQYGVNGNLTLGDCSRQIHLSFSASDDQSLAELRKKFELLETTIARMKAIMLYQANANREKWAENARKAAERRKARAAQAEEEDVELLRPRRRRRRPVRG